MSNFALWSTNSRLFEPAVKTVYDNSLSFSVSSGRMSFVYETVYTIKVSYRPLIGYYRVSMTRVSDGAVIADTGNQYDAAGISGVRQPVLLCSVLRLTIVLFSSDCGLCWPLGAW